MEAVILDITDTVCEKYTAVVAGATLTGIGIAMANRNGGRKVLVVERTSLIGSEFIDSIRHGDPAGYMVMSDECKALKDDMRNRNLISPEGRIHLPPVASLLFKIVKDNGIDILFMTDITGVRRKDGHFELDLLGVSGSRTVCSDIIIDTTAEFVTNMRSDSDITGKSLNCYVEGITGADGVRNANACIASAAAGAAKRKGAARPGVPDDPDALDMTANATAEVIFEEGRFPSETVMKLGLSQGDGWVEARKKLVLFLKARPPELSGMKVICAANTFEMHTGSAFYKVGENKAETDGITTAASGDGWYRIVSCACDNLFEAYDKGLQVRVPDCVPSEKQ